MGWKLHTFLVGLAAWLLAILITVLLVILFTARRGGYTVHVNQREYVIQLGAPRRS